jgi:hypothetical protein
MPVSLTPRWASKRLTLSPGLSFFEPAMVPERGLMVVGGPDALTVFAVGDRQFEWLQIPRKTWITGFAVSASSLYVQDGAALLHFDLTIGKLFSAVNLVTGEHWSIDESPSPPDSIYQLPGDRAALQRELVSAREAHARALASAPEQVGARAAALRTAQLNARGIDYSPPVVRTHQVEGRRSGQVFSLCMDGRVLAMDTALEDPQALATDIPLRPELVLVEIERGGGDFDCYLYYVTAAGGIHALKATDDLQVITGWRGTSTPDANRVAPLRYLDGMLVGGGILGANLFVRTLDPAKPPVMQIEGIADSWRSIDASPREKLLLAGEGKKSRLASYDPAAKCRLRWTGDRAFERETHAMFWDDTGLDARTPSAKLVFEFDRQAAAGERFARLRVLLANTNDSYDPSPTSNIPPPAVVLDEGRFESGDHPDWLPAVDSLPCKPIIAQQKLFAVVGARQASGAWTYSIAAFSLAPLLPALAAKGNEELARLREAARVLEVKVTRIDRWNRWLNPEHMIPESNGPYTVADASFTFELAPGGRVEARTDAKGIAKFDASHAGSRITIVNGPGPCNSATLTRGEARAIELSVQLPPRGQRT